MKDTNKQRNILIIDDSPEDRQTFRQYLKGDGEFLYHFTEAELGEKGLEICRQLQPDCVLVDYILPDLGGLEILAELVDESGRAAFPVVMLTGTGDEEVAVNAMKSGAQDYLVKGRVSPEDLRRAVGNAIDKWTLQRTLDEQRAALTEKNRELEHALESLHLLELGVHQATESIIITTAELNPPGPQIVFVNNAFTQMTGYTADEAIGRNPRILHGPKTERAVLDDLRQKLLQGEVFRGETTNYRKDGTEYTLEWSVAPVRNKLGQITHFVAAQHDITDRKRREEERAELLAREQAARAEAENANRLKDEFLATLSHELRTPLSSILGWSSMLRTKQLSAEETERALTVIERNARAQSQLIEDLLDVSRIITGKLRLDVRPVDLASIIVAATDALRPAAQAKEIRLQTLLDPKTNPISGDADRLQQVVWNLLSNAIKFTDKGGRIEARLEQIDSFVEIKISDTGKGIAPEFLPYVFDRFRQADQTTTRVQSGLGLGLAIVRHLVELHGGSVSVESQGEKKGSTFTVRLPLLAQRTAEISEIKKESTRTATQNNQASNPTLQLKGLHVLIVDDDQDTRELIAAVLALSGSRVTRASSAAEALILLSQIKPDVLVSDIGMPEEDGYSLIEKIRALDKSEQRNMPAIALTAYAREEDRRRALSSGYQIYLQKPVDSSELTAAIARLTKRAI